MQTKKNTIQHSIREQSQDYSWLKRGWNSWGLVLIRRNLVVGSSIGRSPTQLSNLQLVPGRTFFLSISELWEGCVFLINCSGLPFSWSSSCFPSHLSVIKEVLLGLTNPIFCHCRFWQFRNDTWCNLICRVIPFVIGVERWFRIDHILKNRGCLQGVLRGWPEQIRSWFFGSLQGWESRTWWTGGREGALLLLLSTLLSLTASVSSKSFCAVWVFLSVSLLGGVGCFVWTLLPIGCGTTGLGLVVALFITACE